MYCPNCAFEIRDDLKFCTRCGINIHAICNIINARIIQHPQPEEIVKLMEDCHKGYLSTVIGLGLVITSLLIIIIALALGVPMVAISSLVLLGWAIPAIAQGVGKWVTAKKEMRFTLGNSLDEKSEDKIQNGLLTEGEKTDSRMYRKCDGGNNSQP